MSDEKLGQEQGRESRIAETAKWLNASPLDHCGQPLDTQEEHEEAISEEAIEIELETIKVALAAGIDRVECAISNPAMLTIIKAELLPWERKRTVFLAEEYSTG